MANMKGMAVQQTIITLHKRGYSIKEIMRTVGVARNTVRRYVRQFKAELKDDEIPCDEESSIQTDPPDPKVLTGSELQTDPPGSKVLTGSGGKNDPLGSKVLTGLERSQSKCLPYQAQIEESLQKGLHGQRIFQDLVIDYGFEGSYSSVQRFVKSLETLNYIPFRRMECGPGKEAQIDFGQGAWVVDSSGKRRRPWLFRIVLSHSRKAYSEAVWRQNTESFIRALENSFRAFGGVPEKLVPDNLKAVVTRADWYDPDIHSKIRSFCAHYGTVMLPTKPRTPRHKGKVERAIDYAQENALKGRVFESLEQQNKHLREWEAQVADTRIHGTTRQQVRKAFELERKHLRPLPPMLFPSFEEGIRKCGMDGHVEVARSYYSVPPEFTRREVLVHWDSRLVRIFHPGEFREVRIHARVEPGRFSTHDADICKQKINSIERGEHYLLKKLSLAGPDVHEWAKQMLKVRGIPGVRVLQGTLALVEKHPVKALEHACREAIKFEVWHLRELRLLLKADPNKEQLEMELQQNHPVIRPLAEYAVEELFTNPKTVS